MQNKNRQNMMSKSKQELLGYQSHLIQDNLTYFKPTRTSTTVTFAEEIRSSLQEPKKSISPKFFYDENGSNFLMKYALSQNIIHTILKLKYYKVLRKNYCHTSQMNFI